MTKPSKLAGFAIEYQEGAYVISIEDDSGAALQLRTDRDQLDLIADLIEDCLALPETDRAL